MSTERSQGLFGNTVKMKRVLFIGKAHGGEIKASPPPKLVGGFEVANVEMNRGHLRVAHVGDEAHAGGKKRSLGI